MAQNIQPPAHRFDRSELDRVVMFMPSTPLAGKPSPVAPPGGMERFRDGKLVGWEVTARGELEGARAAGRRWFGRMDLLLRTEVVDCPTCHRSGHMGRQFMVEPAPGGELKGDVGEFSAEELAWARGVSVRLWAEPLVREMYFRA